MYYYYNFFRCIFDKKQNSPFEANFGGCLTFQNLLVQSFQAITTYSHGQPFVSNAFKYLLGVRKLNKSDWTPMMEQALNVIYFLAEHPETIAENILQKIATCLLEKSDNNTDTEDSPKSPETENGKKRQKKSLTTQLCHSPKWYLLQETRHDSIVPLLLLKKFWMIVISLYFRYSF